MTSKLTTDITDIVHGMSPVSLEEMDTVKLMNRTDTKFAISRGTLLKLLPDFHMDYKVLEVDGRRLNSYRSLYMDTPEKQLYLDHHNGRTNRYKVRFRKYIGSDLCFLEVKHKYKGRTDKKRIRTADFEMTLSEASQKFLRDDLGLNYHLEPKLWNSFDRITLVNHDLPERLTIDLRLGYDWEGWERTEENLVIVEVKQERVNRESPFMKVAKRHLVRPRRISKYCVGLILQDKELKYNRFKPNLLKINRIRDEYMA